MASTRLIGRDAQLALLRDALVSASAGGPHCVLVTGEAGIGKTRLVAEALSEAGHAVVMTGHAARMSTGEIPFGVLADSLRDLGPGVLTASERDALAPLLPGSASTARSDRAQVLSAFVDLLERVAADGLLVWVVEDLHWADSATLDVVNLAARTLRGHFLLIATIRTEDPERTPEEDVALTSYVAALARVPGCLLLPLNRLTTSEVLDQLAGLIDSTLPPGEADRIGRLSDGVPFVVEELAAVAGRPELATASAVAGSRLVGLSTEARRLVDAAAVGDGHLRMGLVEKVLDATPEEFDAVLAEAARAGILVADSATDALGFRHALLREAADRAMGPGARRSWHRRWAEVLEDNPGVLAADPAALAVSEHWHQAGDVRRGLAASVAAIGSAARICLPAEEVQLWTRIVTAYGLLDDAADITGMSLREAMASGAYTCNFAPPQLINAYFAAVPTDALTPKERLAHALLAEDSNAKGEANLLPEKTAVDAADAFEDEPPDLLAITVWTAAGSRLADAERGAALIRRGLAGARALHDPRAVLGVASMGSYQSQINGDPAGAVEMLHEVIAEYPDESWIGLLGALGNLVWCEVVQGHHDQANAVAVDALGRLSHPRLSIHAWEHLVENATASWLLTGQWDRARALLEEAAPWWEDDVRSSNARLDELDLKQHGVLDVSRWVARMDDPAQGGAPRATIHQLLARAAATEGDLARMREVLAPVWITESYLLSDDQLWESLLLAARTEADAAIAGPRDDRDEAIAHLATMTAVAARFRRYGDLGQVWPIDLEAQLDRFHGRDARPALDAALAGWERINHRPDAAITHLALAESHAAYGDRDSARRHLAAAREIARELDARPMLVRADALAERFAIGSRQRQPSDVLTDREAEVLTLLAEGRTNAQIATTLTMSPKTASVHVSRILAKLGAGNRTEAASIARRQSLL